MVFLKATGIVGSILALIAAIILFIKSLVAFLAFLTTALKVGIIVVFLVLIISVGFLVFRGLANSRRSKD